MCQSRSGFHSSRSQPFFAENDERAVSSVRIEASIQHLGDVAQPGRGCSRR